MSDLESKVHEITMEYLRQNPVTGLMGRNPLQKRLPESTKHISIGF